LRRWGAEPLNPLAFQRILWYDLFIPDKRSVMGEAVKKTISLPRPLAREVEDIAEKEGKTVSAVVQEALRLAKKEKLKKEFLEMQGYWSARAREKGILTERDLKKYMGKK